MLAISRAGRAARWALAGLLLLLLVADGRHEQQGGSAEDCSSPSQELTDAELTAYVLLELSSPAVRYLRAFTVPCWRPAPPLQTGPRLDGTWAVALVTLWNDLTSPNNGLGRLVTAQQLHAEAAAMLGEERYSDSLAILELSVLLRLYPFQPPSPMPHWQRSMALAGASHLRLRLQLARTLVLMARARAGAGAAGVAAAGLLSHTDLELFEGAQLAAEAAMALFQLDNVQHEDGPADPSQLPELNQRIGQQVAAVLGSMGSRDLRALAEERGLPCAGKCGQRRALLEALLSAMRVPLQLTEAAGRSGGASVVPDPAALPRYTPEQYASDFELYCAVVVDVLTLLPPALLQEVGIQCPGMAGGNSCRGSIAAQLASQDGTLVADAVGSTTAQAVAQHQVESLLRHADTVEEVLWRLEEVLQGAAAGVRMADGTTWLRQAGWTWQLAPQLESRLYPPGVAAPDHSDVWEKPPGAEQVCLDKTFLLDTVVRLDMEELQGVQYALDNLHYAQTSVGGPERFWELAGSQNLDRGLDAAHRTQIAELLSSSKHATLTTADFAEVLAGAGPHAAGGEMVLQGDSSKGDGMIAAVLSLCVLGAASIFVYGNWRSLSAMLPAPWHSDAATARGGGAGVEAAAGGRVVQRNAATASLREAIGAGDSRRLAAAIEAAEEAGVEKQLLKKARAAAQALRKKRAQQGRQAPAALSPPPAVQTPARPASALASLPSLEAAAAAGTGARARAGPLASQVEVQQANRHLPAGTGALPSSSRSASLGRSLSEGATQLVQAAWAGQCGGGGEELSVGEQGFVPASMAKRKAARREAAAGAGGSRGPATAADSGPGPKPVSPVRTSAEGSEAAAAVGEKQNRGSRGGQAEPPDPASLSRNTSSSGSSEAPTSPGTPIEINYSRTTPSGQSGSGGPPSPRAPSPQLDTPIPSPKQSDPVVVPPPPPPPTAPRQHPQQQHHHHQHSQKQKQQGGGEPHGGGYGGGGMPSPALQSSRAVPSEGELDKPTASAAGPRVILAMRPARGSTPSPAKKAAAPAAASPKQPQPHKSPASAAASSSKLASPPPPPPPARASARPGGVVQARSEPPQQAAASSSPPSPEATVTFVPRPSDRGTEGSTPQKALSAKAVLVSTKPASGSGAQPAATPASYRRTVSDSAARGTKGSRHPPGDAFTPRPPPPPPPPRTASQLSPSSSGQQTPVATAAQRHGGGGGEPGTLDASPRTVGSGFSPYSSSDYGTPFGHGQVEGVFAVMPRKLSPASVWTGPREHPAADEGFCHATGAALQYEPFGAPAANPFNANPNPFASAASTPPRLLPPASAFAAAAAPALSPQHSYSPTVGPCLSTCRGSAGTLSFEGALGGEASAGASGAALGPPSLFADSRSLEGGLTNCRAAATAMPHAMSLPGARPELLASLQQIWSGASPTGTNGGEGGGLGLPPGGASSTATPAYSPPVLAPVQAPGKAQGLRRSASVPKPPLPSLENPSPGPSPGPAVGAPAPLFDSGLVPAPELALWSGGSSAESASASGGGAAAPAPATRGFGSVLAAGWPNHTGSLLRVGAGTGAAGGEEEHEEYEDCYDEAQQAQHEMSKEINLDLAMLGFTELGD